MITFLLILFTCTIHITPIRVSIALIAMSIIVRIHLLSATKRLFSPSVIVITFSSGIMIVFFYCRIFCIHEKKFSSAPNTSLLILLLIRLITKISESQLEEGFSVNLTLTFQESFLTLGIAMVVLRILGINNRIITPKKSLISSY